MTELADPDFRLEQVAFNEGSKTWKVVVSFLVDKKNPLQGVSSAFLSDFKYDRIYKQLIIDELGNIKAMDQVEMA